ncbi:MAG: tRNA pseudouridine(38-40) synthase TruA [Actinobacteria bacterium]|nr:tRNA pseudouridine(38-40) synthase TruA [Actinomycetota bacterium]
MEQPTLNPGSGLLRFRIDFSYDGTGFSGWARQVDQRTIQGEMEVALSGLVRDRVDLIVAGRTDAGVHASFQVAHFDLPERDKYGKEWKPQDLQYRLNRMLSEEILVKAVTKAPPHFHARFSALRRTYIYRIADGQQHIDPLKRFDITPWYRHLDLSRLNEASRRLLGEHDFATFCKPGGFGTTLRRLEEFSWQRMADATLLATVTADAFCYSMVRNIVGAVVCVGESRFEPEWISSLLLNRTRVSQSMVFPARGLTLIAVEYPADDLLEARLKVTACRRDEE